MNSIIKDLTEYTRKTCGHETRHYLGMSQLHRPEHELVWEMKNGSKHQTDDSIKRLALGYVVEADMRKRLEGIGVAIRNSQTEIVATYDPRVKGHIDGQTFEKRGIYEIKSTVQAKLDTIALSNKLPNDHFLQVQAYLHHGDFQSCLMVYVARDSGQFWVKEVFRIRTVGQMLEEKAKRILAAVDVVTEKLVLNK